MSTYYSTSAGAAPSPGSSYLENIRRTYSIRNELARLNPMPYAFLQHLMMLRRVPTSDPKFIMGEQRDQWQRMNFTVHADLSSIAVASPTATNLQLTCNYDKYGRVTKDTAGDDVDNAPLFFQPEDVLDLEAEINAGSGNAYIPVRVSLRVDTIGAVAADHQKITGTILTVEDDYDFATTYSGKTIRFKDGGRGEDLGPAYAEATGAPDGWTDQLYTREGYCEIIKTGVPLISGSTMATEYRYVQNEWDRIFMPKMNEHKFKQAKKSLFGVGRYGAEDGSGNAVRQSWGFIPYVKKYGVHERFSFAASGYNQLMDFLQVFLEPEKGMSGVPLVPCSRKILGWLNRLGEQGFLRNTFPTNMAGGSASGGNPILDYKVLQGSLGHELTVIRTIWGTLAFVEDVLMRGMNDKYACIADLQHLSWRPLEGNGISRDTFVEENVQLPGVDGRKDQIVSEAGLQVDLPEKHAVLEFV